jgi:hypothetical protein
MNNNKNNRADEILGSLDGVKRASAPDFFYARLRARMDKELVAEPSHSWALRPVYAMIALFVVLLINAVVLFRNSETNDNNLANTDVESIQSLAAEYRVADAGSIYDLNQDK